MILSKGMNISGYLVDYLVSEGPMSTVYRVEHRALRSSHACKLINDQYQDIPSLQSLYVKEMQILSEIRNPFLIRITDVLNGKYGIGIIMDWMDGDSLAIHQRRIGGVEPLHAAKWISQSLSALHLLHEREMFHLEISPYNIFLERVDGGRIAVLMDYGLGRRMEGGRVRPAFQEHSSYYLAPEQVNQPHLVGPSSDIYSMGAVLYELLSGERAIKGNTEYNIMHSIVEGGYVPLAELCPHLPERLHEVVAIAMSPDPNDRYATAFDFITALRASFSVPLLEGAVPDEVMEVLEGQQFSDELQYDPESNEYYIDAQGEVWVEDQQSSGKGQWNWKKLAKNEASQQLTKFKMWKDSVFGKPWFWVVVTLVLIAMMISVAVAGGVAGRKVNISVVNQPDWGNFRVGLDGNEPQSGGVEIEDLGLGKHQLLLQGGMWAYGECGHCCWEEMQSFNIPFGWGDFEVVIDLEQRMKTVSCPTSEYNYYFADIPSGSFMMGTSSDVEGRGDDELRHKVYLTHSFSIGKYEVTQELYQEVMGNNPSAHRGEILPVENIDWRDAIEFSNRLSEIEKLEPCYTFQGSTVIWEAGFACEGYRLPTESEWEYVARSNQPFEIDGQQVLYSGGKNINYVGWYNRNSQKMTHEVGGKYPTAWGVYDMSGNVAEWTWDFYQAYTGDARDPRGADTGREHSIRGGSFRSDKRLVRAFSRDKGSASLETGYIGFRIVRGVRKSRQKSQ